MNKEEAAKELGISVRSLQRLAEKKKISVTLKRGNSGKQEAFFDPDEITNYKRERDVEIVKPASVTTDVTALARSDVDPAKFFEALRNAVVSEQKPVSVAIADKPLLKLDEASALTGLSREILRKAIDAGTLKGKLIGKAYRVKRSDLDSYIDKL
jgi:excisionase family DNA binding protein